jgi:hypothetical protein
MLPDGTLAKLPWDLTVEMWSSNGLSSLEWARTRGGCSANCIVGTAKITGVDFLTTSIQLRVSITTTSNAAAACSLSRSSSGLQPTNQKA